MDNLAIRFFLKEMNLVAQRIGMLNSIFDTPHGLCNNVSVSTAHDMAILSYHCMQNELFAEVVKTPYY
jgi:serine-type D-Ala-D-Ala carboxypeptidase (penicillin-binding protein 5/6)